MASKRKKAATTTKRKRRVKKSHYHTGTHKAVKCKKPINYRSGWELTVAKHLDADPNVVQFWYEEIKISYLSPKAKRVKNYIPDFIVKYTDGTFKIIEVKRENQLNNIWVVAKANAARKWCEQQPKKVLYEFWTDKLILPLQKLEESNALKGQAND